MNFIWVIDLYADAILLLDFRFVVESQIMSGLVFGMTSGIDTMNSLVYRVYTRHRFDTWENIENKMSLDVWLTVSKISRIPVIRDIHDHIWIETYLGVNNVCEYLSEA